MRLFLRKKNHKQKRSLILNTSSTGNLKTSATSSKSKREIMAEIIYRWALILKDNLSSINWFLTFQIQMTHQLSWLAMNLHKETAFRVSLELKWNKSHSRKNCRLSLREWFKGIVRHLVFIMRCIKINQGQTKSKTENTSWYKMNAVRKITDK